MTRILADYCDLITQQVNPSDHEDARYLGLEHLDSGKLQPNGAGRGRDAQSSKFAFKKNDVLYSKLRPYLDKAVLADTEGICTTELLVLRPKRDVDPRFVAVLVHSEDFIENAMRGVTGAHHPRTSWQQIRDFPCPDLTYSEQARLADYMWQVHEAQGVNDRILLHLRTVTFNTLNFLFTRGLRNEVQGETAIGSVPKSWTECKLGEITGIAYGAQAAVANVTDPSIGTLILTNINLDLAGHIDLKKKRYYKVPDAHKERLSLRKGDVLFNWRSGSADHIGKTVYFDLEGEFTYSSFILRFRPVRSVSAKYLFRWLTYLRVQGFFVAQRNVSSINSVYNASLSGTIPIWFPREDEQLEITSILDALDAKIDLHRRKKVLLDSLFRTLLCKLMTQESGEVDLALPLEHAEVTA